MNKIREEFEKYVYYCDDCHAFVDEHHRCEQWNTVHRIPTESLKSRDEEIKKLKSIISECFDNQAYFAGDTLKNRMIEALKESE